MAKPKAVAKYEVCSECGLDWYRHPEDATLGDCVRLLKADLRCQPVYPWQWYGNWPVREPITWTTTETPRKAPFEIETSGIGSWPTETRG